MPSDRRLPLLLTLLVVLAAGCADPRGEDPQEDAPDDPIGADVPDPARDALLAEVEALEELLGTARDHLDAAAQAGDLGSARTEGESAVDLLIGTPAGDLPVLFPVETPDRGAGDEVTDQLTATLTIAREAGGEEGRLVTEALRDLVAGDLGSWQRDADGMVDMVESVAAHRGSVEELETEVTQLPGLATRALAWALLTRDAGDPARASQYAERGAAHLGVALSGIDDLDLGGAQ